MERVFRTRCGARGYEERIGFVRRELWNSGKFPTGREGIPWWKFLGVCPAFSGFFSGDFLPGEIGETFRFLHLYLFSSRYF